MSGASGAAMSKQSCVTTQLSIPPSVWALFNGFKSNKIVRDVDRYIGQLRGDAPYSIEYDANGWLLVSFYFDDLWMLQLPDGTWMQCYVADADCKGYEDTLRRQRRAHILSVETASLGEASIYV